MNLLRSPHQRFGVFKVTQKENWKFIPIGKGQKIEAGEMNSNGNHFNQINHIPNHTEQPLIYRLASKTSFMREFRTRVTLLVTFGPRALTRVWKGLNLYWALSTTHDVGRNVGFFETFGSDWIYPIFIRTWILLADLDIFLNSFKNLSFRPKIKRLIFLKDTPTICKNRLKSKDLVYGHYFDNPVVSIIHLFTNVRFASEIWLSIRFEYDSCMWRHQS